MLLIGTLGNITSFSSFFREKRLKTECQSVPFPLQIIKKYYNCTLRSFAVLHFSLSKLGNLIFLVSNPCSLLRSTACPLCYPALVRLSGRPMFDLRSGAQAGSGSGRRPGNRFLPADSRLFWAAVDVSTATLYFGLVCVDKL